jgi:hypothetical protein
MREGCAMFVFVVVVVVVVEEEEESIQNLKGGGSQSESF